MLEHDELRVYELIWKRAVASQMTDARLAADHGRDHRATPAGEEGVFNASGKAIEFAGFLRAYVEGSDDPSAELGEQESLLPKLAVGDRVRAPDQVDEADLA